MARTIHDLPNEVLTKILRQLDHESLQKARLVSHRWAKAGARGLFHRVYFAPHQDIMDVFNYITSDPAFASGVTELVYDARLFWRCLLDWDVHRDIYRRNWTALDERDYDKDTDTFVKLVGFFGQIRLEDGPGAYDAQAKKSWERYKLLFAQQEAILNNGHDFSSLHCGLQKLPKLKTVSILQAFPRLENRARFDRNLSPWYERTSPSPWRDTLEPTSWSVLARGG